VSRHDDFQAYILSLSPLAYWTFQGLAPGALHDITGNGHDLTLVGGVTLANTVPGFDGFQFADMNGTSGYFTAAVPASLNTAQFTWISLAHPTAANGYLVTTEVPATQGATLGISDNAHSQALLGRMQDGGGAGITLIDTKPLGAYGAAFSLLGLTYDGISIALDSNGVIVNALFNPTPYAPGNSVMHIGGNVAQTIFWKGGISDTAVFSRPLTIGEIALSGATAGTGVPLPGSVQQDLLNEILAAVTRTY
jgi:hypothetical protein